MSCTVLEQMGDFDHEQVVFFQNKEVGLKAIVAIHNTVLGPALGGTRMWPYASEEEALTDVLRLSRGMTYKAAASGLSLGGGKAVIIGDPKKDKSQALFTAYGRFLNTLAGRYITAEDVGVDVNDIEYVYKETDYVVGTETSHGGSGDPSPYTALGTFQGITSALQWLYKDESLKGKSVMVQGVGHVGENLVRLLTDVGAKCFIADVDAERTARIADTFGAEIVGVDDVYNVDCDIYAPCALGNVINEGTIEKLRCKIVAGAANNQLDVVDRADDLRARGILYAPDYLINAGGLINVYVELQGYSKERVERMTREIYYNLMNVYQISEKNNVSTAHAANRLVEHRLQTAGRANNIYARERKDNLRMLHERRGG